MEDSEKYFSISDIMRILHISRGTAYKLVKEEGFPKIIIYNKYLIPKDEFEKWCKERETTDKL